MKLAVIGGGPAGFAAAITLARKNHDVTIFEKNSDVLKKLLITGNGKCNYFNENQDISKYHSSSAKMPFFINSKNIAKVLSFWNELGIVPLIKNSYYYPFSEKSSSMKSALVKTAKELNIKILLNSEVLNITPEADGIVVETATSKDSFARVIIATGSYAYPKTGSTGWGYDIALKMNHQLINVNPSLVGLLSSTGMEKSWSGIRCNVIVKHIESGVVKKEEKGEIQLTDYGVSGICIFNLSRDIAVGLSEDKSEYITINFLPWLEEDLESYLTKRDKLLPNRNITELTDAFLNYKLIYAICDNNMIDTNKTWLELSPKERKIFCKNLTAMNIKIDGVRGYDNAQVCSGGINLDELDNNLSSKYDKRLSFAGELLDLDGDCGGYNLTIAILTGIICAESEV